MAIPWETPGESLLESLRPEELHKLFAHFVGLTEIDASLHDPEGNELLFERKDPAHHMCSLLVPRPARCIEPVRAAGIRAAELREPYIFQCGQGMKCAVALLEGDRHVASLLLGPVLFWEPDDESRHQIQEVARLSGISPFTLQTCLDLVPRISPETLRSSARTLALLLGRMLSLDSVLTSPNPLPDLPKSPRRGISPVSVETMGGLSRFRRYSLGLERDLVAYVQAADLENAGKIFDGLLAEIFSLSAGNLDLVKVNVYELTATLLRSAVDAGVPLGELTGMIQKTTSILAEENRFDAVASLMKEIIDGISGAIFQNGFHKPENRNLLAALRYMKEQYANDITLSSVAKNVFVSEFYLSHLFREEMGTTFSATLAKIRMDAAIHLMEEKSLPIREIAERTGFRDSGNFAKKFRQYHGITPKKYMDSL